MVRGLGQGDQVVLGASDIQILLQALCPIEERLDAILAALVASKTMVDQQQTGAVGQPLTITLRGAQGMQIRIQSISAYTSAGVSNLTIQDPDGTLLYPTPAGCIGPAQITWNWFSPKMITPGRDVLIVFAAPAGGQVTAHVQGDLV